MLRNEEAMDCPSRKETYVERTKSQPEYGLQIGPAEYNSDSVLLS